MKKLLLPFLVASPLLVAASCSTLHELLDVPGAVAEDVGGVIPGEPAPEVEPAPTITPEAIGEVAETGTSILTGNSLLAATVGGLVTIIAGFFLRRKKQATA
jgi:LPXTG-motif cell wall-anchored protein